MAGTAVSYSLVFACVCVNIFVRRVGVYMDGWEVWRSGGWGLCLTHS